MRFRIEHTFRTIDLPDYESLFFDEAFQSAMGEGVKIDRQLVRLDRQPGRITRHVRVAPDREMPAPVAKLLGGRRLAYTEELDYEPGRYRGTWRIVPGIAADKITVGGTLAFEPVSGGVRRVLVGDIEAKLFGLGGLVERVVVSNVESSYDDAALLTQLWIDEGRGRPGS
jgi:hypothetical protein